MKLFGLTGGMGSGKSEAARRFRELGIPVIDADRVGHGLLEPGSPVYREAAALAGGAAADGTIDRAALADRAFTDPEFRGRLNRLLHPAIYAEIGRQCAVLAEAGHRLALVEAALLGEGGRLEPGFSGLVLVSCPEALRLRRLAEGRGVDAAEARRRMAAQADPETKRALAGWVIENDGDLERLRGQVDGTARLLRLAAE